MKRQIALVMAVVLLLSCFAFPAVASEPAEETKPAPQVGDPIYLVDGTIITIGPVEMVETRGYILSLDRAVVVSNSDYEEACRLTLKAKFLVNDNNTITCISSLYETSVSIDGWAVEEASSTCSDHGTYSVATASAHARKRLWGILTKNIPISVSITAYSNGTHD